MNPGRSNDGGGASSRRSPLGEGSLVQGLQLISPHGIFTTDAALRLTGWNEWLASHSGLAASQVVGRRLPEIFTDLKSRRLLDRYERVLKGEISVLSTALHKYLLPFPTTVPEGGSAHMLQTARIAPLREGETVVGTVTIIEDVTQREYHSAVLLKQQEMDRLLSFALAALLKAVDPATEINAIFAQVIPLLGLDAFVCYLGGLNPEVLQLHSASGITAHQREAIALLHLTEAEVAQRLNTGDFTQFSLTSHAEAIRRLNFRSSINFPIVAGQRFLGLVSFASYDRATISAANLKALARLAGYVAIALDRAIREQAVINASRAKDDFLATLSHELRTPLNPVVLIASDSALNPAYPPEAREAFRMIEKNAQLEARLIDDLLDLTKIERDKLALDLQRVDVHAVLSDAIATVRADAMEHRLKLHLDFNAKQTWVNGDSGRLQQVFWNVIKNSVKFTPPGGEIRISTSAEAANAQIAVQVTDTGIGMHPGEAGRIFDAFAQGDHSTEGRAHRFGGLGLGLAISRKIITLHGGHIEAASAGKGKGATITILLPLAQPPLSTFQAQPADGRAADIRRDHKPAPRGTRILLLEDHETTRRAMQLLLQRKGCDVVAVGTCAAALAEASRRTFDLVLSDIGLPDGDGVELMKTLKENYGLKGIALTGYGMEKDIQRSNEAGFLAHLTKPINANLLDRAMAEVLGTPVEDPSSSD